MSVVLLCWIFVNGKNIHGILLLSELDCDGMNFKLAINSTRAILSYCHRNTRETFLHNAAHYVIMPWIEREIRATCGTQPRIQDQ